MTHDTTPTPPTTTIAPAALAAELNIDPKRLRAYLRQNHTRPADRKNTTWAIAPDVADAARTRFAPATPNA